MTTVQWPRVLSPAFLAQLIRRQRNPVSAVHLFLSAPSLFPSYRHNPHVVSSLFSVLLSAPSFHPLVPPLLLCPRSAPPLPDSLFAEAISSLPARLSVELFLALPSTSCIEWTQSFNCLIDKLLSNNQPKTAVEVFLRFSRRPEVKIESKTIDMFISSLLEMGRPDLGLELYKEYYQLCLVPSHEINCMLVKSLVEHDKLDEAMHLLYSVMRNYEIESIVVSCRTVIEALCLNGRTEEGTRVLKRVLHKVRRRTGRVRSFLRIPIEFEGKSLEEIRETVDFVLSFSGARNVKAYETITEDLYKERRFEGADKVFDEMTSKGFKPSVFMYEVKIEALCKEGNINEAVRVLEQEMREKDYAPTVKIFNFIIQGFCKNGESLKAIEYLKDMKRWPKCGARKETYQILINGLCNEKRYGEAVQILDRMVKQSLRPTDEMFDCVIRGLCEVGNRYEAVLWLEEMVESGTVPNRTLWYELVLLVCNGLNDVRFSSCFEVLEEMNRDCSL
ncbi:hypothetical protein LUZ60_005806 [Juncus effusus]|nr:hypothetical protein LUZ60_005806 [Juncus effusus]